MTRTVLLVEDNPGDARLMEMIFQREGTYYMEWASTLGEALTRLEQGGIDVILLDMSLPDSHGAETLERVLAASSKLPIIVMTGLDDETGGVQAVQSGAQDFLTKGEVRGPALIRSMNYAIERKRAELAEREQRILAEALASTAAALSNSLELEVVFDAILETLSTVFHYDWALILLVDDDRATPVRCHGYSAEQCAMLVERSMHIRRDPFLSTIAAGCKTFQELPNATRPLWADLRANALVGAPMHRGEQVLGFIVLQNDAPNSFAEHDAPRLQAFTDLAATAVQNARLYEEVVASRDALETRVEERTRELRRTKERVEAILTNSPDGILSLRPDGTVQQGNLTFWELFGHQPDSAVHALLLDYVSPESAPLVQEELDACRRNLRQGRLQVCAQTANGASFDADLAISPIVVDDELIGFVCSFRDISDQKRVERMKDQFVSNVSHELRTPITSMKIYLDLIRRRPQSFGEYSEKVNRELLRLGHTIDDLLNLSKLDQGTARLNFELCDLNEIVPPFADDRMPVAESKGFTLGVKAAEPLPMVTADDRLLVQVLSILLVNAMNYTTPGGTIWVSTHTREDETGLWAGFSVSDNGPGIDPEEQDLLFERFFRGKVGRESGKSGTGLGLSIALEIVRHHNGLIEVHSTGVPGEGTTFMVWLPAQWPG